MPAPEPGHGGARLNPIPGPRLTQPDPPTPLQSRRKSTPPVSRLPKSSRSSRPRNARQPPCQRQIPIDRTARAAEPNPPAVSSPEACPTPADRVRGRRPATAGVRQPLTKAEVQRGLRNVRFRGQSGSRIRAAVCLLVAMSGSRDVQKCGRYRTWQSWQNLLLMTCWTQPMTGCAGGDGPIPLTPIFRRSGSDGPRRRIG